jgi:hypothetical protein
MAGKPNVGTNGVHLVGADRGDWGEWYPKLCEWLCDPVWDDGSPIDQVRLSVRRTGALVVVSLQCAALGGIRVEAQSSSPDRALAALEALLSSETVPWTQDPYPIGRPIGKRK